MSLTDHLSELRTRVIRIVLIIIATFFVCYHFGPQIQEFLLIPLKDALGSEGKVVFIQLLDKILTQFQLAFWSSIIVSSPLWFSQIWFFIKPGLYENEVKLIRPFLFLSFLLFWAGVCFGYYIVFPNTFEIFLNFGVQNIDATLNLKDYIVLSLKILVFLGIIFQLPNIILILGFMGVVDSKKLKQIRPYVVTGFAVLSAILTPPDPVTMLALLVPLAGLYELGIWTVFFIVDPIMKRKNKDLQTSEK